MSPKQFGQYQADAMKTEVYPHTLDKDGLPLPVYPALALCGEAGEAAEKVKKAWRDGTPLNHKDYLLELGDCLWYITAAAHELGATLEDVAGLNLEKLKDRRARGVLGGSGDHR